MGKMDGGAVHDKGRRVLGRAKYRMRGEERGPAARGREGVWEWEGGTHDKARQARRNELAYGIEQQEGSNGGEEARRRNGAMVRLRKPGNDAEERRMPRGALCCSQVPHFIILVIV